MEIVGLEKALDETVTEQFIQNCSDLTVLEIGLFDDIEVQEALESLLDFGARILDISWCTLHTLKLFPLYEKAVSQQMCEYIVTQLSLEFETLQNLDLGWNYTLTMEQIREVLTVVKSAPYFSQLKSLFLPNPTSPDQDPSTEYVSLLVDTLDEAKQLENYTFFFKDLQLANNGQFVIFNYSDLTRQMIEALSHSQCLKHVVDF